MNGYKHRIKTSLEAKNLVENMKSALVPKINIAICIIIRTHFKSVTTTKAFVSIKRTSRIYEIRKFVITFKKNIFEKKIKTIVNIISRIINYAVRNVNVFNYNIMCIVFHNKRWSRDLIKNFYYEKQTTMRQL